MQEFAHELSTLKYTIYKHCEKIYSQPVNNVDILAVYVVH